MLPDRKNDAGRALWWDARRPVAIGATLGAVLASVGLLGGALSAHGWVNYAATVALFAFVGGYLGVRSTWRRHGLDFDAFSDETVFGALIGALIGIIATRVWNFTAHTSYDPSEAIAFGLIAGGLGGLSISSWRQIAKERGWSFLLGAMIAYIDGGVIAIVISPSGFPHPELFLEFHRAIERSAPSLAAIRGLPSWGALLGAVLYLLVYWGQRPRGSISGVGSAIAGAVDGTIDAAGKIGAFAKGSAWLVYSAGLAWVGWMLWRWLTGIWGSGIWDIGPAILICLAAIAFVKALAELRFAFKGSPRLASEGVHGDAGDAGPEDVHRAMRGGRSPVDDRIF